MVVGLAGRFARWFWRFVAFHYVGQYRVLVPCRGDLFPAGIWFAKAHDSNARALCCEHGLAGGCHRYQPGKSRQHQLPYPLWFQVVLTPAPMGRAGRLLLDEADMTDQPIRTSLMPVAGQRRTAEDIRRDGWFEQGIVAVPPDDPCLDWFDREVLEAIGTKLWGPRPETEPTIGFAVRIVTPAAH